MFGRDQVGEGGKLLINERTMFSFLIWKDSSSHSGLL